MVVARTTRGSRRRRQSPGGWLIEYESVFRPPPASVDRRTFLKTAAAGGRDERLAVGCRTPGHDAVQRHPAHDAVAAGRRGFQPRTGAPAVSGRSAGGHADRRRPAAVRRRLPDRRDVARARLPSRRLSPGESGAAPDDARGKNTTNTPSARRRDRIPRRWCSATASSTIRRIACSRCGTWAAIRRTPASRCRTTASTWEQAVARRRPRHEHHDGDASRFEHGLARSRTSAIRRRRYKMASWYDNYLLLLRVGRRHPLARASVAAVRPAIARRSSTTRSARSGSSACATMARPSDAIGAISKRPTSTRGAAGRTTGPVAWVAADRRRPAPPGIQRAGRALQPRLRRLRKRAARFVHDLPRRADRAREAERHLRRLQPRRLPLGSSRSASVPAVSEHVGDWNWANVQSAGGVLPGRRRPAAFLRQRPARRAGQQRPGCLQHRPGDAAARRVRVDGLTRGPHPASKRLEPSPAPGTLITRPVALHRTAISSSISTRRTETLRVEVLDRDGRVITGVRWRASAIPVRGDTRGPA